MCRFGSNADKLAVRFVLSSNIRKRYKAAIMDFSLPLETERLTIRALKFNDLEAVFSILNKETSGGRVFEMNTLGEAERWLRNRIAEQNSLGYSIWAVEKKSHGVIGVCGLIPNEAGPIICYAVNKHAQCQGYGSEAARAVLEKACTKFDQIISTIRRSNISSIRVAEKIGMKPSQISFSDDPDLLSYVFLRTSIL